MIILDLFNTKYEKELREGAVDKVVSEGGPYDLPGKDYDRPGDTPRQPRPQGDTSPRRHPDDPDFMDPDQRRLRADQARVAKANAERRAKKEQGVAEGSEELVGFHVDTELAYQAVMRKFGDVVSQDPESGTMYVPSSVWTQVEQVAFDADGRGAEREEGVSEAATGAKPGWMLKQDPALAKKVKDSKRGYEELKKWAGKPVPKDSKQGVAEARPSGEITLWRVEQSDATGRYHVVTGYQKRKIWKNKLGAVDFVSKDAAQKKADELNQTPGVAEGSMYGDEEVSWEKGGRRAPTGAFRNPAAEKIDQAKKKTTDQPPKGMSQPEKSQPGMAEAKKKKKKKSSRSLGRYFFPGYGYYGSGESGDGGGGEGESINRAVAQGNINELSTEKLAQYKTAAGADAAAADKRGDYKHGDKRFAGIVKATKKQFANDVNKHNQATVKEESSTGSDAVEQAILKRIMVSHTDLLRQFGPDKVMQAAEEVAYGVGDVDEIGTSDVSAYVRQVRQILGA